MSNPACHDDDGVGLGEFVVSPRLAQVAEHDGLPLHAGDRVRFEVIDGGRTGSAVDNRESWPPAWVGSITTDEGRLGANARDIMRTELGSS